MAGLNWDPPIANFRGAFLSAADLEEHSYVFRLLSGAEPFEDERDPDPRSRDSDSESRDADPELEGLVNPLYEAEIEAIRERWERNEAERRKQEEDVRDIAEKAAERVSDQQWVPCFRHARRFPRLSYWSKQQQRFVVDMLVRYWASGVPANAPTLEEQDEVRRLMKLITDMRAEQEEYFEFAREVNATQLERYNAINPRIDAYIENSMTNKIRRARDSYPRAYHQLEMLPLAPAPAAEPPTLLPTSEPLELGEVAVCVVPRLKTYTDVKRQASYLEVFFPSADVYPGHRKRGFQPRDGTYLYKMPVSSDPNIVRLSAQQEFDLVTSPSALKTLLDNSAPWDRHWELPVTVRLVPGVAEGTHRKVVFVDKPLPPRSLTFVERTYRAHKRTARLLVCKRVTRDGPADYSVWREQPDRRKTQQLKAKVRARRRNYQQKKRRREREAAEQRRRGAGGDPGGAGGDGTVSEGKGEELEGKARDASRLSIPQVDMDGVSEDSSSEGEGLQIDWPGEESPGEEGGQAEEEGGRMEEEGPASEERPERRNLRSRLDSKPESPSVSVSTAPPNPVTGSASHPPPSHPPASHPQPSHPPVSHPPASHLPPSHPPPSHPPPSHPQPSHPPPSHPAASPPPTSAPPRSKRPHPPTTATPAEGDPQRQAKRNPTTEGGPQHQAGGDTSPDPAGFLRPPPGLNVHYRVWRLGRLRLLLRAVTHGMREDPNTGLVRYSVHAKPAYQPGLGIEVMTRAEVLSQWLDCMLRPHSRVVRVHLDPETEQVIAAEERSLGQLTEEFAKYDTGFRPPYGLQVLESVLHELTCRPPGQYLLSHDGRAGAFVRLSRAGSAPGGGGLNLDFPAAPVKVALESPRCLNIDPSILTPFNTRFGRVPATFRYKDTPELGEGGWKEYWAKMKKQGVRRKKKNKKNMKQQQKSEDATAVPDERLQL